MKLRACPKGKGKDKGKSEAKGEGTAGSNNTYMNI
jgi:hypothetical protein